MMRTITHRLEKLEKAFPPAAKEEDRWGEMAHVRDELLRQAEERGEAVDDLKQELEAMGPAMLWCEIARDCLIDRGFVPNPKESMAEMFARALDMTTDQLTAEIAQGRFVSQVKSKIEGK